MASLYPGAPAAVTRSAISTRPPPVRVPPRPVARAPVAPARPAPVSQTLAQAANQQVNQQINPQLAAQDSYNARQNAAIQGFAQALLGKLQPIAGQVGANYDTAINQTAGLSNQAATFLQNANPDPQVQALLQNIGAPQSQQDQVASALQSKFGGGGAVLSFLGGTVPGSELAANKAAAQSSAAQLPGFAALKAQQDLASALGTQTDARNTLLATRPGLFQTAERGIQANNLAQARNTQAGKNEVERVREFGLQRGDKQAQFAATQTAKQRAADFLDWYRTQGLGQTQAKIDQKAQQFGVTAGQRQQQIGIAQTRANTAAAQGQQRIGIAQQNANTAASRLSLAEKKASGVGVNAKGALTAAQTSKLVDAWKNGTVKSITTIPTDPKTGKPLYTAASGAPSSVTQSTVTGKKDYGPAYARLVALGVPDKKARQALDSSYQRGEQGRSWLTNEEQAALAKAGQPARATVMKGRGVLKAAQVQALQAVHKLPPGQLTAEGAYVISPGY